MDELAIITVRDLQRELASLANPEAAAQHLRFFKTGPGQYGEGDLFRGIRAPVLRNLATSHHALPLEEVLKLLRSSHHEDRWVALLILVLQFKAGNSADQRHIYQVYLQHSAHINNWDLVDSSAMHIVGAWLADRSRKPLLRLAQSHDLWERRIAIMATFHLIRQNDFVDTFTLADLLLQDEHDLIHKAVGWMLREVGNRDRTAEEAFLLPRYRHMPRTMLRYAIEKFPEQRRNQYLKGTI